jgi:hypothetical protein
MPERDRQPIDILASQRAVDAHARRERRRIHTPAQRGRGGERGRRSRQEAATGQEQAHHNPLAASVEEALIRNGREEAGV